MHIEQQVNVLRTKYEIETDESFEETIERTIDGWKMRALGAEAELAAAKQALRETIVSGFAYEAALRAERDALRADADRYRWLRKNACYIWRNRAVRAGDQEEDVAIWIKPHVQIKDKAIDAALDAALRGEGE